MAKCKLCGRCFKIITGTHLSSVHNCNLRDYAKKFGVKSCGFLSPNLLPKNDPRYKKWRESLKKRPAPWNKGLTKEIHPSVAKISRSFKRRKIDNFARWREKMIKQGLIRVEYPSFQKCGGLAELIGVVLGDGHIETFPRTERLSIFSNSNNLGFVKRYSQLVREIFNKEVTVYRKRDSNCTKISIYQKKISKRLGVPAGARKHQNIKIPCWILKNEEFLIRYLRGLYEAEGSFSVHKPTYTYKFIFVNKNESLLENVYRALGILGFHPHRSKYKIQVSRKEEVYKVKDLIKFRQY